MNSLVPAASLYKTRPWGARTPPPECPSLTGWANMAAISGLTDLLQTRVGGLGDWGAVALLQALGQRAGLLRAPTQRPLPLGGGPHLQLSIPAPHAFCAPPPVSAAPPPLAPSPRMEAWCSHPYRSMDGGKGWTLSAVPRPPGEEETR